MNVKTGMTTLYDYDFANYRSTDWIYGIHPYPAMLHYMLVRSLILEFSKEGDLVLDPFCGSGVVINESIRLGRNAVGIDINPLGLLIGKVRTLYGISVSAVLQDLDKSYDEIKPEIPHIVNIDYWYSKKAIEQLGKLRSFIRKLDGSVKELFAIALAETARYASYTRKNEFKRFRMENYSTWNPDIYEYFINKIKIYEQLLNSYPKPSGEYKFILGDSTKNIPVDNVSLVLTSPPYGDSRTTVAYGQYSSFGIEWLNGLVFDYDWRKIDNKSIGATGVLDLAEISVDSLRPIINSSMPRKRDILLYFTDLFKAIRNIARSVKSGGYLIFVIGNRRVNGVEIPTSNAIAEYGNKLGLELVEIRNRNILYKRMPLENSPSNIKGNKGKTMSKEYIVILKKP